jgi:hypothetical protein
VLQVVEVSDVWVVPDVLLEHVELCEVTDVLQDVVQVQVELQDVV